MELDGIMEGTNLLYLGREIRAGAGSTVGGGDAGRVKGMRQVISAIPPPVRNR